MCNEVRPICVVPCMLPCIFTLSASCRRAAEESIPGVGEARRWSETSAGKKTGGSLRRGPQRVSPEWKAHASHPGLCGPRARFDPRDPFSATSDSRRQRSERKKRGKEGGEERKRGCALINMSYKNAGVHNLHEPKTESKNRYALSLSSLFLSV